MGMLWQDIGYAIRTIRRQPGTAIVVVTTFVLGVGACLAVFSVVKGVLLDPLPYINADRLYSVWSRYLPESGFDFEQSQLSPPEYFEYRDLTETMESVAAWGWSAVTLTDETGNPERVTAAGVTANLFDVLETRPMLGRTFLPSEDVPNGPQVAVIGYSLWQTRFGGDSSVIGSTTLVNGVPYEVVGIMPEGFAFPTTETRVWFVSGLDPSWVGTTLRTSHWLQAVARVKEGVPRAQVDAELARIRSVWAQEYPDIHTGHFLFAQPLLDDYIEDVRPALLALFVAVSVVVLIVCANVAGVLLARGEQRQREMALRTALGAGHRRIIGQLFTETATLTLVGLLGSLGFAWGAVTLLSRIETVSIPRAQNVDLDMGVLLFSVLLSLLVAFLAGLTPAIQAARVDVARGLREAGRAATSGRMQLWFRKGLVTGQIALAVLLVIGAGLTTRSFVKLINVERGFESSGVLLARVSLPPAQYGTPEQINQFWDALLDRMRGQPSVTGSAVASAVPVYNSMPNWDFEIEGRPEPNPGSPAHSGYIAYVSHEYLSALGIRLIEGRFFDEHDNLGSPGVTVINETMAHTFWPDGDVLGRRLQWGSSEWVTVVGVISDARVNGLDQDVRPVRYAPAAQGSLTGSSRTSMVVVTHTTGPPESMINPLRGAVAELDPNLAVTGIRTLEDAVRISVARPRFTMTLMGLFAAVALLLGTVGVFGVVSHMVTRRNRELGIRMALGAKSGQMARLVLRQGLILTGVGAGIGMVLALVGARLIRSLLFDVTATDTVAFLVVPIALGVTALAACLVPALRATRVQPVDALRTE